MTTTIVRYTFSPPGDTEVQDSTDEFRYRTGLQRYRTGLQAWHKILGHTHRLVSDFREAFDHRRVTTEKPLGSDGATNIVAVHRATMYAIGAEAKVGDAVYRGRDSDYIVCGAQNIFSNVGSTPIGKLSGRSDGQWIEYEVEL